MTDSLYHLFKIYLVLHVVGLNMSFLRCLTFTKEKSIRQLRDFGDLVGEAAGSGSKSCGPGRGCLTTATVAALFLCSSMLSNITV